MKKIKKDELYKHLSEFLQNKGIKLERGSYAKRIRQGCGLLTEAINVSQTAYDRAKTEMDKTLEQMKRAIKKTKDEVPPKTSPTAPPPVTPTPAPPKKAKKTAARQAAVKAPKKKTAAKRTRPPRAPKVTKPV